MHTTNLNNSFSAINKDSIQSPNGDANLYSIELEREILGAVLLDRGSIKRVKDILTSEDFYLHKHGLIYGAALEIYQEGLEPNLRIVTLRLRDKEQLDGIGGQLFLGSLVDVTVTSANIDYYANRVAEKANIRREIAAAEGLAKERLSTFPDQEKIDKYKEVLATNQNRPTDLVEARLKNAADQVREILRTESDELTTNLKLERARVDSGMSGYDWENKIVKPLKRDLSRERFSLELLGLLQIDDPVDRILQQAQLAPKYSMSASTIEKAMQLMKQRTTTLEAKALDIDELFDLESEGLTWLIPELLPVGETIILAGSPKAGKTLLAFDAGFAIATGESSFLGESVKQGKVLIVEADESLQSTKSKLLKRGIRRRDQGRIRVLPQWNITQMGALERQLEDFRPDVVIIDSLRRIHHGSQVSENSAEFADTVYTLKETLARYGASGILIHHSNKNSEAMGVDRLRGSSAIAGAVWGVWQLDQIPKPDPNNKKKLIIDPKDPTRVLSVHARDTEGQTLRIVLDPENNSWSQVEGVEDEAETVQRGTVRQRIFNVLEMNSHLPGLSGSEIISLLEMTPEEGRGIYTELNRMTNKRLISCHPAPGDKRFNLYSIPKTGITPKPAPSAAELIPPPPPPTYSANC